MPRTTLAALTTAACLAAPACLAQGDLGPAHTDVDRAATADLVELIEGGWTHDRALADTLLGDAAEQVDDDVSLVLDIDYAAAQWFNADLAALEDEGLAIVEYGWGWAVEDIDDHEAFVFAIVTHQERGGYTLLLKEKERPEGDAYPARIVLMPGIDAAHDHLLVAGEDDTPFAFQRADNATTQRLTDAVGAQLDE